MIEIIKSDSNTTLVKVKLFDIELLKFTPPNSNTTLVKVKSNSSSIHIICTWIQIQHLLKLNVKEW